MEKLRLLQRVGIAFLFSIAAVAASSAQSFNTLASFDFTNGDEPFSMSLIQATNGDYFGTTFYGGEYSGGTVFKVTSSGALTTIYDFCSESDCSDGKELLGGLVEATNGALYGTTIYGGVNTCTIYGQSTSCGTIFKITLGGKLTTLDSFDGTNGALPYSAMIQAGDGDLYGTTGSGGAYNYGTVFKMTLAGQLTTLYSFCAVSGCPDGNSPQALLQGSDGNFYGTTLGGGANRAGTVFKITPAGTLTTLYSFCSQSGCSDGYGSYSGLVQGSNGNFYGTTSAGGIGTVPSCDESGGSGYGTIFEITPSGVLTTLHSFKNSDGSTPDSGVVQATDGNFYGTTACGGADGAGTIFQMTAEGVVTTLYSFAGPAALGAGVQGGLLQATNGTFYGTTPTGGADGDGTVFSLSNGLKPFVETLPASGKVGASVSILGNNLKSATAVEFNGTSATFTAVSGSLIKTTVPTGATTGTVTVTTSSGTLVSNVPFRVLK
jgi:uncharacterized repeat protein (TIGR03803 family)